MLTHLILLIRCIQARRCWLCSLPLPVMSIQVFCIFQSFFCGLECEDLRVAQSLASTPGSDERSQAEK